jgi:hypothetical protein
MKSDEKVYKGMGLPGQFTNFERIKKGYEENALTHLDACAGGL